MLSRKKHSDYFGLTKRFFLSTQELRLLFRSSFHPTDYIALFFYYSRFCRRLYSPFWKRNGCISVSVLPLFICRDTSASRVTRWDTGREFGVWLPALFSSSQPPHPHLERTTHKASYLKLLADISPRQSIRAWNTPTTFAYARNRHIYTWTSKYILMAHCLVMAKEGITVAFISGIL